MGILPMPFDLKRLRIAIDDGVIEGIVLAVAVEKNGGR